MKFADYFQDAIKYGESLELKQTTRLSRNWIELNDLEGNPVIYAAGDLGLCVNGYYILPEQQLKLVKLFVSAYEQYLADKKEPVAADSAE